MELVIELVRPQQFGMDDDFNPPKEVLRIAGNGGVVIGPMDETRRGRWLKNQMHPDWADGNKIARAAPDELPGYHIAIDIRGRKVRVFDPLHGTPKGEDVARRFESIGLPLRLEAPKPFPNLGDSQLWGWLKWAARVVRDGLAEIRSGEIPAVVWERIEQERQWDLKANPNTGERPWEPEPSLFDAPPKPQKAA